MFGIGFWELVFLLLIALLILGPERLPAVARKLGYWSGRARMAADALRSQIEREMDEVRPASGDAPAAAEDPAEATQGSDEEPTEQDETPR